MSKVNLPLSHLTVLDLTRARAGPTAARHLADWGADVIKIEMPSEPGDEGLGGVRHGPDFLNLHRNKRSITLNLKKEKGRQIFLNLAREADVIVENYRPDVQHRLGIDYQTIREINPRIVYGSISGFGQDGPLRDRPGLDQIAQGMGGLMSITGLPGQGPVRVGVPIADLSSGNYLAMGILLALIDRDRSGEGQWVHTSLLEAQIAMLDFQAARWLIDGEVPPQAGNNHPTGIPMGVYPTSDGAINIAAAGETLWRRFLSVIDAPKLAEDSRFANGEARSTNRDQLNKILEKITVKKSSVEWINAMNDAGVPCGPIYRIDETFADPQVQHLGIARQMEHDELGPVRVVGQAVNLSRQPQPKRMRRPTPKKGSDTDDVLLHLGLDANTIDQLRNENVI